MFLYFLDQPVSLKWSSEHVWNSAGILAYGMLASPCRSRAAACYLSNH